MPIVPTDNDVLSGRGRAVYGHAGNARLLSLVRTRRPRFQQTTNRVEKRAIAHEVANEIHRLGGRFLMEDPAWANENGSLPLLEKHWIEADEQRTTKKVMHALREKDEEGPSESARLAVGAAGTEASPKSTSQMKDVPRSTGNSSHGEGAAHRNSGQQLFGNQQGVGKGAAIAAAVEDTNRPLANSIGIQNWMTAANANGLASKKAYILGSIELAWWITKHLIKLVGDATSVDLHELVADNVVIFVDASVGGGAAESRPHMPSIRQVVFLTTLRLRGEGAPVQPRDACAALGKIVLRLFSLGRSSASVDFSTLPTDAPRDGNPPPQKRRARSGNASTAANNELLAAGMPLSIRRLVCDLLGCASTLEEALWDIVQMRSDPQSFLWDQTHPGKALEQFVDNDETLFGRENELAALMKAKENVSTSVLGHGRALGGQGNDFVCEAAFVGGYAGSGKSSLLLPLSLACNEEQWFVLGCKFDKQAAPVKVLCSALDDFFGKWGNGSDPNFNPALMGSFQEVCEGICSTIDEDGFHQLSELVPNFTKMYPHLVKRTSTPDKFIVSSMDKVGSAKTRLQNLIQVLLKSLCSAGRPVLLSFDDLQWCDSFVLEGLTNFIVNNIMHNEAAASNIRRRRGLLLAGTYRSNEVSEDHPFTRSVRALKQSQTANITMVTTGELSKTDVTKLLSAKLYLPWRYTRDLAHVAHSKTRGNPFFIIHFLRSIVSNKMLEFSVRSRRWIWDSDVVEMQMISDGVAELLAASFNQLPTALMQAMKIVSCLGYQVERRTIDVLDSTREVLSFSILDELHLAVKEGILERAGPVYQFTHDIVQQTIYELIPPGDRKILHKLIGQSLLKSTADNPTIHLLAADQINIFCKDATPCSPEERAQFARSSAVAAKLAIADSSFERARSYVDVGMRLLEPSHWETQYSLSINLFEMSASVSLISGDISSMSTCLGAVLSHVMTFEDSLKASSMLAKLLASNSKYDDATNNCLDILKNLGEDFPSEVSPPLVQQELPELLIILRNITLDQIKQLPPMTDERKINAMKFLNMLCMYCAVSKPLLLPFLSRRMVQLTLEDGFCEDSTVGIATAGFSVYLFTEDLDLAGHLGKVSESLVDESPKKHRLRARLCNELYTQLKLLREPWPSVVTLYPELYSSAMLAGDIENALICRWTYSAVAYWSGTLSLPTISEQSLLLMKEAAKYQQNRMLYNTMAIFQSCIHLSGRSSNEVEMKSLDEIIGIGEETNGTFLVWHAFMHKMSNLFWSREFGAAAELSEKYSEKHHSALHQKRAVHVIRVFYEGITYLNLARGSGDAKKKWREMGEKAVETMAGYATSMSKWNFENKSLLLKAELHYLNGDLATAAAMYEASIKSAREHTFINEEALAYELYGRFCVENYWAERGSNQLRVAVGKYKEWGATKKANDVQLYHDTVL